MCFKDAMAKASPCILEPYVKLDVIIDDEYLGDIMSHINKKRGRVLGMNPLPNGKQEILADIPQAELYGYSTTLRSMTGGSGEFSYEFARYEQAPSDVQEKEVALRASEEQE